MKHFDGGKTYAVTDVASRSALKDHTDYCGEENARGFRCTRFLKHRGDHVATNGERVCARWSNDHDMPARRSALRDLIAGRYFGVTRRDIVDALPDWYEPEAALNRDPVSRAERQLFRDLAALEKAGLLVRFRRDDGTTAYRRTKA